MWQGRGNYLGRLDVILVVPLDAINTYKHTHADTLTGPIDQIRALCAVRRCVY